MLCCLQKKIHIKKISCRVSAALPCPGMMEYTHNYFDRYRSYVSDLPSVVGHEDSGVAILSHCTQPFFQRGKKTGTVSFGRDDWQRSIEVFVAQVGRVED
jgi:hypothetical protein